MSRNSVPVSAGGSSALGASMEPARDEPEQHVDRVERDDRQEASMEPARDEPEQVAAVLAHEARAYAPQWSRLGMSRNRAPLGTGVLTWANVPLLRAVCWCGGWAGAPGDGFGLTGRLTWARAVERGGAVTSPLAMGRVGSDLRTGWRPGERRGERRGGVRGSG